MQNREKSFVHYLLSLSMLLPAAAVSASVMEPAAITGDEAQTHAASAAVAAKLSRLASTGDELAFKQNWWNTQVAGPEERDDAAHLSSADLLALSTKLSHLTSSQQGEICNEKWHNLNVAGPDAGDDAAHLSSADLLKSIKTEQA